jgi:deoxyribose-phosphate aldolase
VRHDRRTVRRRSTVPITRREIARFIDHTLLRADATEDDLARHCEEAAREGFAGACVAPVHVGSAALHLAGTKVKVVTVIGFPLGFHEPEVKAFETRRALRDGAEELDVVIQVGLLKAGRHPAVREELAQVRRAAEGRVVKAILETALLDRSEIEEGCRIAMDARVDFVKTSTGFGPGGATLEDVRLMRSVVGDRLGVKASGGIRDAGQALALIESGATRLGTSRSLDVLAGLPGEQA